MRAILRKIFLILATAFLAALFFALATEFFYCIERTKRELMVP